jgi:acetyltransferase-like isoleucine patch superfamily enzyme
VLRRVNIRVLQVVALWAPGVATTRVWLHRRRGVTIGEGTAIGADTIIETEHPELITIGERVHIGIRNLIIGHFGHEAPPRKGEGARFSVVIEDDVYIGPGVIVLPGSRIGYGSVVTAGSVVTGDVRPMTVVRGNPARPVARCGVPLGLITPLDVFQANLKPIRGNKRGPVAESADRRAGRS